MRSGVSATALCIFVMPKAQSARPYPKALIPQAPHLDIKIRHRRQHAPSSLRPSEVTWRLMKSGWAVDREGLQKVSSDESTL